MQIAPRPFGLAIEHWLGLAVARLGRVPMGCDHPYGRLRFHTNILLTDEISDQLAPARGALISFVSPRGKFRENLGLTR